MMGRNRSWMSQTNRAVEPVVSLPVLRDAPAATIIVLRATCAAASEFPQSSAADTGSFQMLR
jgi:hypothetical protein